MMDHDPQAGARTAELIRRCRAHSFYTWCAQDEVDPLPLSGAEGIYLYLPSGERPIDFNSGSMCVNIGHGDQRVIDAIQRQVATLPYAPPSTATEIRATLSERLVARCPGDINKILYTLGGADANENAIRMARLYTGRHKIICRYRSYHGATRLTSALTGDPRRWPNELGSDGIIRTLDPEPYSYSLGDSAQSRGEAALRYLEELIMYEGPTQIAAVLIETVTGTNGVLVPPPGYLSALRALLDRHGILLICDEVMAGFGRTGAMFAVDHWEVVPDLLTMAKGLTSGYLPLGAVGLRAPIAEFFRDRYYPGGLTYNAHPSCLAAALANLDVLEGDGLIERAAARGELMSELMRVLKEAHPSVRAHRNIGLLGMIDLQRDREGTPLAPYNGRDPLQSEFIRELKARGLYTFMRWGSFMCTPPLCIREDELRGAFEIIDEALTTLERALSL